MSKSNTIQIQSIIYKSNIKLKELSITRDRKLNRKTKTYEKKTFKLRL
jgi:hypothetical protein